MSFSTKRKTPLALALAGATALVLSATAASAQEGFYYGPAPSPDEPVIVTAPPYTNPGVSRYGGRIGVFTLSRAIHAYDVDLTTPWGQHELYNRVRTEARLLCDQLDRMQPLTVQNSPPCYRTAVENADYQVDAAIRHAYEVAER